MFLGKVPFALKVQIRIYCIYISLRSFIIWSDDTQGCASLLMSILLSLGGLPAHLQNPQVKNIYNLKISTYKTKIMAFKGKHLVQSKIEIDGSILEQVKQFNYLGCDLNLIGFGGLEVACWPLVPKFAGSNPAKAIRFLSTPSFGREVKPSVPCRRFAACKRPLELCESRILYEICRNISRPRRILPSAARGLSCRWTWRHLAEKMGTSKGGGKPWQPTPKNLPRMQCARAIAVAWLGSGSC
jgi:hypothetical protein